MTAAATPEGGDRLVFFPNSPYARMARVLVREWALPIGEEVVPFGAPDRVRALNPLVSVPVLLLGGTPVFPVLAVLERLWALAGSPRSGS